METTSSFTLIEKVQVALTTLGFVAYALSISYLFWFA